MMATPVKPYFKYFTIMHAHVCDIRASTQGTDENPPAILPGTHTVGIRQQYLEWQLEGEAVEAQRE